MLCRCVLLLALISVAVAHGDWYRKSHGDDQDDDDQSDDTIGLQKCGLQRLEEGQTIEVTKRNIYDYIRSRRK